VEGTARKFGDRQVTESIINIGAGKYKSYEIKVDGKRVYFESILTTRRSVIEAAARRHDKALEHYSNVQERIIRHDLVG
jgi:hypothetical protein